MRRLGWLGAVPVVGGLLAIVLVGVPVALGASANAEPETQSHAHGVPSTWTLTWGGDAPFDVDFYYGDGVVRVYRDTWLVRDSASHAFWPCSTTIYTQWLRVWDSDFGYADDFTRATEAGGSPC